MKKDKPEISYKNILDALPYYVLIVDSEHNILFANKETGKTFNKAPEELIGLYCPQAIHGKDHPIDECPLEISVKTKTITEKEIYDSEYKKWFLSGVYPTGLKTKKGKEIYLHQIRDISVRKNAELQVRAQKEELVSKNIALRELLGCIESEKKAIEKRTVDTLDKLILPRLKPLFESGSKPERKRQAELIRKDIRGIVSSFGKNFLDRNLCLSRREIEICSLIKEGLQNKQIAGELALSVKTVETVRKNIRKKLSIKNKKINLYRVLKSG